MNADRERLIAGTITTFHALNAENARLQKSLAQRQRVVIRHVRQADTAKAKTDSILAEHPIAKAPVQCAPWANAVLTCQLEAANLRAAVDTLEPMLKDATSQLARADSAIHQGERALNASRCHFPCIKFSVVAGGGVGDDLKFHKGLFAGLKIFGN